MDKGSLNKSFINFEQQIRINLELISDVNKLNSEKQVLTQHQINQITELVFLKIYLSWEIFLEDIFIKLILISKNYYKIVSYAKPKSYLHAQELLKANNNYPNWTDIDKVIKRSKDYFLKGFPLSNNLNLIRTQLIEMKRIRNNLVHMSQKAKESFENLMIEKNCPKKYSCGEFLLKNKDPTHTYLNFYITKIKDVAKKISDLK